MPQDKSFVITAHKDIRADDVDIKAGDRVAVVTGLVSPLTLFGLMQFHGFQSEEMVISGADADASDDSTEDAEPATESDAAVDDEAISSEADASEPNAADAAEQPASEAEQTIAAFVADGLDEKTARALVEANGLTPDSVRQLIADGKDLLELDDIGVKRAEKVAAAYAAN